MNDIIWWKIAFYYHNKYDDINPNVIKMNLYCYFDFDTSSLLFIQYQGYFKSYFLKIKHLRFFLVNKVPTLFTTYNL